MSNILSGKDALKELKENLKDLFNKTGKEKNTTIGMGIIVSLKDDDGSVSYLKARRKICDEMGVNLTVHIFENEPTFEDLKNVIESMNNNPNIHGIMIDRPLPKGIDEDDVFALLDYKKDIDGCHPFNAGRLLQGKKCFAPSTARAVVELLKYYNIEIASKEVVVIGRSKTVGSPVSFLLLKENSTVTITHSKTKDLRKVCQKADIIVVAIGRAAFINSEYVNENTIIVDVGIHYGADGKMLGDVDKEVYEKVKAYSPVPGGVGPLTNYALMQNLFDAYIKEVK